MKILKKAPGQSGREDNHEYVIVNMKESSWTISCVWGGRFTRIFHHDP